MRIQDLESSLGAALFDRNRRSARLTAKGQELPQRKLSPANLDNWPLLTLTHHSNLHKLLARWFEESGATAKASSASSIGVLGALTIAGLGVSYLPREHFNAHIAHGELQVLNIVPRLPDLQYFAVYEKRPIRSLSQTIAELAQTHSTFVRPAAQSRR
jgi:DNA-binding transcriptional LysR family regulator